MKQALKFSCRKCQVREIVTSLWGHLLSYNVNVVGTCNFLLSICNTFYFSNVNLHFVSQPKTAKGQVKSADC